MKAKTLVNLKQVMDIVELKWSKYEEGSFYEFLEENTQPTSGTWDEWFGWFFYEWMRNDDNTFDGRKFYKWLLENYI